MYTCSGLPILSLFGGRREKSLHLAPPVSLEIEGNYGKTEISKMTQELFPALQGPEKILLRKLQYRRSGREKPKSSPGEPRFF